MYFLKKLALIILLVISNGISAQKMEDKANRSDVLFYKATSDQKEIILSSTPTINNEQKIILKIKTPNIKNPIETVFQTTQNFVLVDILLYSESIYYLAGYEKLSSTQYNIALLNVHAKEGLRWYKKYAKEGIEIPKSIIKLKDDNIGIGGFCASETEEYFKVLKNDLHVLKVS